MHSLSSSLFLFAVTAVGVLLPSTAGASSGPAATPPVSRYRRDDRQIGSLDVDRFTAAPLQIVLMARLDLAPEKTFELVSRELPQWVAQIPHVAWDNSQSATAGQCGAGSVRQCAFGKDHVVELIRFWQEGRLYAYSADPEKSTAPFPIKDHLGVFVVESDGHGGSLLTWRQYFNGKFSLLAPLARFGMRRIMKPALQKLIAQHGGELLRVAR